MAGSTDITAGKGCADLLTAFSGFRAHWRIWGPGYHRGSQAHPDSARFQGSEPASPQGVAAGLQVLALAWQLIAFRSRMLFHSRKAPAGWGERGEAWGVELPVGCGEEPGGGKQAERRPISHRWAELRGRE